MSEAVSEMDNLPKRWITSSVGQLYKIVGGGTPSTRVEKYWNGDIPWISSADIHGLYDIRPRRKIAPEAIKNSATNLVPAGSIIVVTRVGLGKIARINTPLCFSQDSQALIENVSFVNPDYMLYYLSQAVQSFKHASRGTTISGVTKKQLSDLLLPVAPLNEQKRIVSKIESIFAQIDAKQQELEKLASQIKSVPDSVAELKSSILEKVFEGKLVPQDPHDEPAEILLKKIHKDSAKDLNFEKKKHLPKGWLKTKIGTILEPTKKKFEPQNSNNRIFIGLEHIESNTGKILVKGNSMNTKSIKTVFHSGDILYGKLRPYLNKVCIPNFDGVCSTDILVFSQNENFSNKYVSYFLSSPKIVRFATRNSTGMHHPRIKFELISKCDIPLPPLNEQKRIVSKIQSIFAQIDAKQQELEKLASQIKSVPDSVAELKSSILKKAFEGKLMPQDPHDESASVLLEKIKRKSKDGHK